LTVPSAGEHSPPSDVDVVGSLVVVLSVSVGEVLASLMSVLGTHVLDAQSSPGSQRPPSRQPQFSEPSSHSSVSPDVVGSIGAPVQARPSNDPKARSEPQRKVSERIVRSIPDKAPS
jgi:hypothetical protein